MIVRDLLDKIKDMNVCMCVCASYNHLTLCACTINESRKVICLVVGECQQKKKDKKKKNFFFLLQTEQIYLKQMSIWNNEGYQSFVLTESRCWFLRTSQLFDDRKINSVSLLK